MTDLPVVRLCDVGRFLAPWPPGALAAPGDKAFVPGDAFLGEFEACLLNRLRAALRPAYGVPRWMATVFPGAAGRRHMPVVWPCETDEAQIVIHVVSDPSAGRATATLALRFYTPDPVNRPLALLDLS